MYRIMGTAKLADSRTYNVCGPGILSRKIRCTAYVIHIMKLCIYRFSASFMQYKKQGTLCIASWEQRNWRIQGHTMYVGQASCQEKSDVRHVIYIMKWVTNKHPLLGNLFIPYSFKLCYIYIYHEVGHKQTSSSRKSFHTIFFQALDG